MHDGENKSFSVRYENMTAVLAKAIQEMDINIESIATSTPGATGSFADRFFTNLYTRLVAWAGDVTNGVGNFFANAIHAKEEICVDDQCLNKEQVKKLIELANTNVADASTLPTGTSTTSTDITAPVISILGDNPAEITVGTSYVDIGATVTDTGIDGIINNNLGLHYSVDGITLSEVTIDTSTSTTHTVIYSAQDQSGNWGYATRTINIIQ